MIVAFRGVTSDVGAVPPVSGDDGDIPMAMTAAAPNAAITRLRLQMIRARRRSCRRDDGKVARLSLSVSVSPARAKRLGGFMSPLICDVRDPGLRATSRAQRP